MPHSDSIGIIFMSYFNVRIFLAFFFAILIFVNTNVVSAQSSGIKIIPAQIEEGVDPGDVINETITITNVSDEDDQYFLFRRNIKGVEAGGVPIFAESDTEVTGYEITEWIDLQDEPLFIPAGGSVDFDLQINVPENATPGSHFGGLFVSKEPPKLREIGAGVGYEVAVIISIRISGDILDSTRIRSFSTDKLFYGTKDVNFVAKIENQGNILVRPRGPLTITSMFGGNPAVILINDSQAGVFPGSVRDLQFSWNEEGLGFGRYEAVLALGYEGEKGQRTIDASLVFWVFPAKIIVPLFIGMLVFILGGYFFIKLHIKKAVSRASGGRRIVGQQYRRQVGISRFAFVLVTMMVVLVLFLILLLIVFA